MSATIKKSTLLTALQVTLFQMELARDVHPKADLDDYSPYEITDNNTQSLTFDEQEDEIRQAINIVEKLDDSEYGLIDINIIRTMLED
jgi:hypothetical protein